MEEEIKRYTEELYNEIFGNGQGTVDEFDWEDIAQTIEETAHHFANWQKEQQPHWKPSEDEVRLINTSISFLKDFADKGYENAVECIDWLKSLPERFILQPKQEWSNEDRILFKIIKQ